MGVCSHYKKNKTMYSKKLLFLIGSMLMCVTLLSCSSDDDNENKVNLSPISLYVDEETHVAGTSTLKSQNDFVAMTSGNTVKGFHVGETYVATDKNERIPVEVKGKYNTYQEPITEWGCNRSYVQGKQTQGTLSSRSDEKSLIYENVGHASMLMYSFEGNKLKSIGSVVSTSYTEEFASYLAERFLMTSYEKDNDTYFIGIDGLKVEDAKTAVVLQVYNSNYLIAVYMPVKDYSSSSKQLRSSVLNATKLLKQMDIVKPSKDDGGSFANKLLLQSYFAK